MKFKKLFFTVALALSCFLSFSQSESSFFSTLIRSRGFTYYFTNFTLTAPSAKGDFFTGISIFGFEYGLRKNVYEINANNAVSVAIYPALNASGFFNGGIGGVGSFNLPILAEYNYGNVSTWDADLDKGYVFGLGLDFRFAPLFVPATEDPANKPNQAYIQGMAKFGYRYWGRTNKPKEVSLKLGFGLNSYTSSNGNLGYGILGEFLGNTVRSFSGEIYWSKFLNY